MITTNSKSNRIDVADVLRGFSIMGIVMLHCIEHFNFYRFPDVNNEWLKFFDAAIWDSMFFILGGKAYAIFALLFGFSFFIQDNNQLNKGNDFRLRFLWRLVLLFIWGNINAMFFTAEILVLYSLVGVSLLFIARLNTKTVFFIAIIMLLQPIEWWKLMSALTDPSYIPAEKMSSYYWGQAYPIQSNGTFLETVKMNLWDGQMASLTWAWENGRVFQTAGLFMMGMLLGRTELLKDTDRNIRFWRYALVISVSCFFPLNGLVSMLPKFIESDAVLEPLRLTIKSIANLSFMIFLISVLIVTYYKTRGGFKLLDKLRPYGKMTLTAYITQSVMGSALFYNWGLGLDLCVTYSFLVGVVLFLVQYIFACWWMKNHRHGPLEYIWKKATWIGSKK